MKSKAIAFIAIILVLIGALVSAARRTPQQLLQQQLAELQEKEKSGRIKLSERVQLAKARGKDKIAIPGTVSLYPSATSPEELNQILSHYTVVIAQPIGQKGYVGSEEAIRSWHKFKILKTISQAPPAPAYASLTPPEELLPVGDDEFLVHRAGGTVMIEGVEVTAPEEGVPAFRKSQKYLLVLSLDPNTRIAQIALGDQSILPIKPDNTLYTDKHQEHILQRALREYHGNSIERLTANMQALSRSR